MSASNESELTYSLLERRKQQVKEIKDAIEQEAAKAKWDGRTNWGPWSLDDRQKHLLYAWVNPNGDLIPDRYELPLRLVVGVSGSFGTIEDWCAHLLGMSWITFEDVLQVVVPLCSLYNACMCGEREQA